MFALHLVNLECGTALGELGAQISWQALRTEDSGGLGGRLVAARWPAGACRVNFVASTALSERGSCRVPFVWQAKGTEQEELQHSSDTPHHTPLKTLHSSHVFSSSIFPSFFPCQVLHVFNVFYMFNMWVVLFESLDGQYC